MIAKASNLNLHDPSADSHATIVDKETQTSKTGIELMSSEQTPSKPTPPEDKNKDKACKDDNIKVFEFCELVKDPQDDSISIIKETFTEEVINSPEGSVFGKPTHNRYKYSREVITPYCKSHTSACPKYMPTHREIPFKKSLSNTSKDSKKLTSSTGNIIMSPNENKTTFENPSNASINKEEKRGKVCNPTYPKNETKQCQKEATNCEPYSKCAQFKDETKLKEYLSSCLNTTVTIAKKASAACLDKCEKTIGILPPKCGEEKPTYYVLKKPKSKESITDKSSYDSIFDSDIVQNISSGVKGVIDSVVNTTKETVKIFTNSSCKDLQVEKDGKPKDCENKSVTKVASLLPNEFKNQEVKEGSTENTGLKKLKTVLSNTFKRQSSTNSNEIIEPKSQDNVNSNENSIGLTKLTSIFKSKEDKTESSEKSSLTKIKDIFPNPFKIKEQDNSEASKGSLTKLTSIFTDSSKSNDDTESETKRSLTRINSVISNTFKRDDRPETSIKDNVSLGKIVEPAVAAIERVASAVTSVRGISMTDIINSRLDRSSPEDNPNITRRTPPPTNVSHELEPVPQSHEHKPPTDISHEHKIPTNISHERENETENPSMFTMIKTKFLSMFADSKEDDEESEESDEEEAEKMYSKFSDQ